MTNTRAAAIKQARKESRIQRSGWGYRVIYWDAEGSAQRTTQGRHAIAQTIRAQILIDTTLDLLGLEADITYTGGSWTTYIPKVTP